MKIHDVYILDDAVDDMEKGKSFYDHQQSGIGSYFWDSLLSDIESLIIYAGIHKKISGLYQMYSKRFPFAVYYTVIDKIAYVVAVLPMRRDPEWISKVLTTRNK